MNTLTNGYNHPNPFEMPPLQKEPHLKPLPDIS